MTSFFVINLWHCLMVKLFQHVRSNYQVASRSEQGVNNSLGWANKGSWLQGQVAEVHSQLEVCCVQTGKRCGENHIYISHHLQPNLYWYGRILSLLSVKLNICYCFLYDQKMGVGIKHKSLASPNVTNHGSNLCLGSSKMPLIHMN